MDVCMLRMPHICNVGRLATAILVWENVLWAELHVSHLKKVTTGNGHQNFLIGGMHYDFCLTLSSLTTALLQWQKYSYSLPGCSPL